MYNRYIPQGDGTYRKNPVPHPAGTSRPPEKTGVSGTPCASDRPCASDSPCTSDSTGLGIGAFLRSLLPRALDVEDLMVILLLLIMSGDSREEPNTALLTLMLYLFL